MGGVELWEVIEAYHSCRRRKRSTKSALRFELNWEAECVSLWEDINSGTYRPGRSIAFIVDKPTKREVFAASFRDRVVHHLIADKIQLFLEEQFILDSYATQHGKGTHFGIRRVAEMMRECTENYTRDAYVMKVDIKGYFMSIDKKILTELTERFVRSRYRRNDVELLLWLIRLTVENRPERNCIRRSLPDKWVGLPRDKSLFGTDGSHGLPIGNLSSQLLALLYLDEMDHLIRTEWGIRYYGRYVDDIVLIDRSPLRLLEVRQKMDGWLRERKVRLHPRKFYLQHCSRGVLFIGGMIKPRHTLAGHRSIGYFRDCIAHYNEIADRGTEAMMAESEHFRSSMNSYFGQMSQFHEWNMCHRLLRMIDRRWFRLMYVVGHKWRLKVVLKRCVPIDINPKRPVLT